jgi:hypothetical protein
MRTLKKSGIDELRKIMPVLDEEEQSTYRGGDYYFGADGTMQMDTGGSDTMYVWNERNGGYYSLLSAADKNVQQQFMAGMAYNMMGYSGDVRVTDTVWGTNLQNMVAGFVQKDDNSGLFFSESNMYMMNNYWQMASILEHEAYHYNYGSGIATGERGEDGAYQQQVSGAAFMTYASEDFRRYTAEGWYEAVKGLPDYSGSSIADFYEQCGLGRDGNM